MSLENETLMIKRFLLGKTGYYDLQLAALLGKDSIIVFVL